MVTGFTTMPDSNFFTCRTCSACSAGEKLRWMTPMPPACAMAMASLRLGDGVHGGGQDRNVEVDVAGDAGADVGLAGHDLGMAGLQQHVVEGQRQRAGGRFR